MAAGEAHLADVEGGLAGSRPCLDGKCSLLLFGFPFQQSVAQHRHADLCEVTGIPPIREAAAFARESECQGEVALHLLPLEYAVSPMSSWEGTPEIDEDNSDVEFLFEKPTGNAQEVDVMQLDVVEDVASSSKRMSEENGGAEALIKRSRVGGSSDEDDCIITLPDLREFERALSRPGQTEMGLSQVLGNLQAARQQSQSSLQHAQDLVWHRDELAESLIKRMEEELARMRHKV